MRSPPSFAEICEIGSSGNKEPQVYPINTEMGSVSLGINTLMETPISGHSAPGTSSPFLGLFLVVKETSPPSCPIIPKSLEDAKRFFGFGFSM